MDEDGSLQARIDLSFDSPVYAEWYDTGIIPHRCSTPFMIFNPYMFLRLVDRRYQWRQNPRDRLSVNQKLRLARAGIFDQQILSEREWLQHYATDTYPAERRRIHDIARITLFIQAYEEILSHTCGSLANSITADPQDTHTAFWDPDLHTARGLDDSRLE